MDIAGISGILNNQTAGSASSQELDKNAFMQLLVTQLQNQDPFKPMDSQAFAAQLAQFSSLEQSQNMNDSLEAMILLQQETFQLQSLTQGSALIGKEVGYFDPYTGENPTGLVESVELKEGIVTLKVGDENVPLAWILEVRAPAEE